MWHDKNHKTNTERDFAYNLSWGARHQFIAREEAVCDAVCNEILIAIIITRSSRKRLESRHGNSFIKQNKAS